jgi:predicted nuclease of predicted toxin-antitoxin system
VKLLVDENLSPTLVQRLASVGVPAVHVAHCGLSGATDPVVWRYGLEHDLVVVTSNAGDFIRLAEGVELHPGLIVLRAGHLSREEQWAWLAPVARWLIEEGQDLANRAVMVTGKGKFSVRDIPPP